MRLVFDIEADGFYHEATQIWCIVAKDIDTGRVYEFDDMQSNRRKSFGVQLLEEADELIGHNIIDYDLRLIKKLYPKFCPSGKILDTMILSQLLYPERKGGHSLEAFGEKYGILKPVHEDWSRYTPEMLHRCKEDVKINIRVYEELISEAYEDIQGYDYKEIFTGSV